MLIIPIVIRGIVGHVPGVSELVWIGLFGPLRLQLLEDSCLRRLLHQRPYHLAAVESSSSDVERGIAIVGSSFGVGATLLHQSPHCLLVAIKRGCPDWSAAIVVGIAGVGAELTSARTVSVWPFWAAMKTRV